ncbi:jg11021 [Pararge aegeria aegeria]|uniref:Jg11021 protein n=1 Tax=Pararge aegeria aegeria TaxID=348720 RepID=A0A8S4SD12_9NEOP|nr:jg11021 [Pararge aegeria aegeria]
MGLIRRLRVTQRAMERAMLRVSLRDLIRNEEISGEAEWAMGRARLFIYLFLFIYYMYKKTIIIIIQPNAYLTSYIGDSALLKCYIARRTDGRWGLKVLEWRPRKAKRSVGRPPTRWTSGESMGAAGGKRPRTVDCRTSYKRPMSSSGPSLVEMMMMM